MSLFLWSCVAFFVRALLSLRYRIEVKGLETICKSRRGGILFLPNHTAHMDPLFCMMLLWPKYRPHGLAIEYIYRTPGVSLLMKIFGVLPIPELDNGSINQLKVRRAEQALDVIAEGLRKGENYLFYASGRLKSEGREIIGGASGAHTLMQKCPEANVVLIRTTGLWGSSFSRAYTGKTPNILAEIASGIKTLFRNGIFFAPRRKIVMEFANEGEGLPRQGTRLEFNRALEKWYNQYPVSGGQRVEEEPLKRVSYSFWKEDVREPFVPPERTRGPALDVPKEVQEAIAGFLRQILENPSLQVSPEMHLSHDVGLDSLNIAEVIAFLAQTYGVKEVHPEELETVQDLFEAALLDHREPKEKPRPVKGWPEEEGRPELFVPNGRSIPEAFLNSVDRMGGFPACADDVVGVMTYKRMKQAALVLSEEIRKWPDEQVGILLPSSVAAYLLILAVQFAGKIPVMLNWTLGPRPLEEMLRLSGTGKILTSQRFLERLSNIEFGSILDKMVLLEDLRAQLPLSSKLKGAFLALLPSRVTLALLGPFSPDDSAVILFTSGTEATPKGVPLSHRNILSNQRSALQCVDLRPTDVLLGILPPFHSFGFSVVGLFPVLAGVRVAYSPDPTDSFALAAAVAHWKITLFCGAPSFIKSFFQVAKPEQMQSLRVVVSGAEKAPPELFERVKGIGAEMLEGYGITECAPILAISRPGMAPKGVGIPLPDVEVRVVHPETGAPLAKGSEGELVVRGPNVFSGYLGNPRSPFITLDGERWYRTGDMGHLDADGCLVLTGRLKRFAKLGGEMISLGAVEEVITAELSRLGKLPLDAPGVAVVDDGQGHLTLFTVVKLTKEEANELLKKGGLSRLVKISAVKYVSAIPLLGTGKTDYRGLQGMIA